MEKKRKNGNRIRNGILAAALLVFVISAWQLITIWLGYKAGTDEYSRLADDAEKILASAEAAETTDPGSAGNADGEAADQTGPWTEFYRIMREQNEDYVGWIKIEDTNIDYPVVQYGDNDYYLSHTFEKAENAAGTLFVDCQIEGGMEGKNVIVYGHNMKNGSMFANLKKYRDEDFYEAHKTFQVYTETGFYTYEIFAVYVTSPDSETYTIGFADEADFMNYIQNAKAGSLYESTVEVKPEDRVITLSTCVNQNVDRLVIQARRLES